MLILVVGALLLAPARRWFPRAPAAVFLAPFLLNCGYLLVSLMYVEHVPVYLHELDVTAGRNGAALTFLLYQAIFVAGFAAGLGRQDAAGSLPPLKPVAGFVPCMLFAAAVLAVVYVHLFASSGIPLFDPYISKQRFWTDYARLPMLRSILGTTSTFIPFVIGVGWLSADSRARKLVALAMLATYLGYVILLGHKFGALYYALVYAVLPSAYARLRAGQPLLRMRELVVGAALAAGIVFLIIFQYARHPLLREFDSPWSLLFYRAFALTGQLWWRAHGYLFGGEGDLVGAVGNLGDGLIVLMRLFATTYSDVEIAIERGSNFSDANPAIALLVWGPVVLVVHQLLTGAIWGWLTRVLRWQMEHASIVEVVIAFQLFGWYFNTMTMGSYNVFFNARNAVLLLVLLVTWLVRTAAPRRVVLAPESA